MNILSKVFLTALFLASSPLCLFSQNIDNRPDLGVNLWFHTDFNNSFIFTDIVRRARNWGSVGEPFNRVGVNVDALGWPQQDAGLFLHTSQDFTAANRLVPGPAPLPAGTYRIIFNGQAAAIRPSVGTIGNQTYDQASNTTRAEWTLPVSARRHENTTIVFTGTRRTASDSFNTGLTNLRIFLPGFPDDGSVTFTPAFLNLARQFGIIRFMEAIDANKNPLRDFADRITPAHASYNLVANSDDLPDFNFTGPLRGIALEHMVQLCNETDSDMWLNIPARATDDCVRRMLELIRDGAGGFAGLEPGLNLYLEYGNEVWNSFAPQAGFLCFLRVSELTRQVLQLERTSGERHPINFDGLFDAFQPGILTARGDTLTGDQPFIASQMRHRFVAFRIKTIGDIAREVFGDGQMITRIRPILASQFGDGQLTFSTGLRFLDECFGVVRNTAPENPTPRRVNEMIFGGGGAPYSLGNIRNRDGYFRVFPHADFVPSARIDAVLARGYGIRYVAYEGGPSLGDPVTGAGVLDSITERKFQADPRMRGAVADSHTAWLQAGGDIFTYFVLTGDPTFEFAGHDGDFASPKMRGYDDIRRQPAPAVTTGTLVPAMFDSGSAPHAINDGGSRLEGNTAVLLDAQSFVGRSQYLVPVRTLDDSPPPMRVSIEVDSTDRGASSIDVLFNGVRLATFPVTANVGRRFLDSSTVSLQRGLNVITLRAAQGQTLVRRIRVESDPIWNENTNGTLSAVQGSPTPLVLHSGLNGIVGSVGGNTDDHFTFTVPVGRVLSSFVLASYASTDPMGWVGLQNGASWTAGDNRAINPALLRANQHFGTADIGQALLGISPAAPLPAGTYTVKVQQFGADSAYRFELFMQAATFRRQTIAFKLPPKVVHGDSFTLRGTSDSNLPVTYELTGGDLSAARIDGDRLTILKAAPFLVTARQPGDSVFAAAMPVERPANPTKRAQKLAMTVSGTRRVGQPLQVTITINSDRTPTLLSSNVAVVSPGQVQNISPGIWRANLTVLAVGRVTLTASQLGDPNHTPAKDAGRTITIR